MDPAVKRLLPPDSSSGAASSISTEAPCSCAASAAQNAAFPAPTTMTSACEFAISLLIPQAQTSAGHDLPFDAFSAAIDQRLLIRPLDFDLRRRGPRGLFERDRGLIRRQPIVPGAVERGKGLELVERVFLLEHFGIGLDRHRRIEHARDAVHGDLSWLPDAAPNRCRGNSRPRPRSRLC